MWWLPDIPAFQLHIQRRKARVICVLNLDALYDLRDHSLGYPVVGGGLQATDDRGRPLAQCNPQRKSKTTNVTTEDAEDGGLGVGNWPGLNGESVSRIIIECRHFKTGVTGTKDTNADHHSCAGAGGRPAPLG